MKTHYINHFLIGALLLIILVIPNIPLLPAHHKTSQINPQFQYHQTSQILSKESYKPSVGKHAPILPQGPPPPQLWNTTWGVPIQSYSGYPIISADVAAAGDNVFFAGSLVNASGLSKGLLACYNGTTGNQKWNVTIDFSPSHAANTGVATDGTSVYVAGTATTGSFEQAAFVCAFAAVDGAPLWMTVYNTTLNENSYKVAVNGSSVYLTGSQTNSTTMNPEAFIANFDTSTGTQVWNTTYSSPVFSIQGFGIDVNGSSIYISGVQDSSIAFVAKYTHTGSQIWNTTWTTGMSSMVMSLAANTSAVYAATQMSLTGVGTTNGTLVKIAANGVILWEIIYPSTNMAAATGVAIDGNVIYLVGAVLTGITNPPIAILAPFLASYNVTGHQQWNATYIQPAAMGVAFGVAVDGGNIFVSGILGNGFGPPQYGGVSNMPQMWGMFLAKFNGIGSLQWEEPLYSYGVEYCHDVTIARHGLYVTGALVEEKSNIDLFLRLYDFNGNLQWETIFDQGYNEEGCAVTVTRDYVYVAGYYASRERSEVLIVCFDLDGVYQWNTTYNALLYSYYSPDLLVTSTGLYLSGTQIGLSMSMEGFLVGFDALTGAYLWNTTWSLGSITQVGGLATIGNSLYVTTSNETQALLFSFDMSGNEQWNTTWGKDVSVSIGHRTAIAANGSLLYLAGTLQNTTMVFDHQIVLACYDSSGIFQWNNTWGMPISPEHLGDLTVTSETICITGMQYNYGIILSYNATGDLLWNTTYGVTGTTAYVPAAIATVNNSIFIAGLWGQDIDAFIAAYGSAFSGLGDIIVYVEDALHNPLQGASVVSTSQPIGQAVLSGTTNATGYAEFMNVYAGDYSLLAADSGYLSDSLLVTLNAGETYLDTLTLQGIGTLVFHVEDAVGNPIAGVDVVTTSQPSGQPVLSDTTNATGQVQFENVFAGDYLYSVTMEGYIPVSDATTLDAGESKIITITLHGISLIPFEWILVGAAVVVIVIIILVLLWRRRAGRW